MKSRFGIWEVGTGKGNRHYINCIDGENNNGANTMHLDQIGETNGAGVYEWEHLQDLAVAILKLEEMKNRSVSIETKLNKEDIGI